MTTKILTKVTKYPFNNNLANCILSSLEITKCSHKVKPQYDIGTVTTMDSSFADARDKAKQFEEKNVDGEELPRTMGTFMTFFTLIKAYCAINVLLLPLSFRNGGYILSPVMMVVACFFQTLCAIRLSEVANKYKIWTYPGIALRAMGNKGYQTLRLLLMLAHI